MPRLPTDYEDYDPLATITPQQAVGVLTSAAPTATKTQQAGAAAAVPQVAAQVQQQLHPESVPPVTVYVRNGEEYGSITQIAPPGSQLVFSADDANLAAEIADARQKGYSVGINVVAAVGDDPAVFANRCAWLSATFHPDILVPNVEFVGKGYEGSAGWQWSQTMMQTYSALVPNQKTAVAVMPGQDDFNYAAYTESGAGVWVETYGATLDQKYDPQAAIDRLLANGVPKSMITQLLAPGQSAAGGTATAVYAPPPGFVAGTGTTTTDGGFTWSPPSPQPYVPGTYINVHGAPAQQPSTYPPGTTVTPDPNQSITGQLPPPVGTVQYPPTTGSGMPGTPNAGGITGTTSGKGKPQSWADYYFGSWGLSPADMAQLVKIMSDYADPQDAVIAALAYVRGTGWYATHFPGINYGIQHGLYSDEAGYRDYVNRVNVASNQYNGRPVSADEVVGYLQAGLDPSYVGKLFEGNAWATANSGTVNYELGAFSSEGAPNETESKALGQQQVGLSSQLGLKLQQRLQTAAQKMQRIFEGQVATPNLSLGAQGLNAPSLGKTPDLGA